MTLYRWRKWKNGNWTLRRFLTGPGCHIKGRPTIAVITAQPNDTYDLWLPIIEGIMGRGYPAAVDVLNAGGEIQAGYTSPKEAKRCAEVQLRMSGVRL